MPSSHFQRNLRAPDNASAPLARAEFFFDLRRRKVMNESSNPNIVTSASTLTCLGVIVGLGMNDQLITQQHILSFNLRLRTACDHLKSTPSTFLCITCLSSCEALCTVACHGAPSICPQDLQWAGVQGMDVQRVHFQVTSCRVCW